MWIEFSLKKDGKVAELECTVGEAVVFEENSITRDKGEKRLQAV